MGSWVKLKMLSITPVSPNWFSALPFQFPSKKRSCARGSDILRRWEGGYKRGHGKVLKVSQLDPVYAPGLTVRLRLRTATAMMAVTTPKIT